MSFGNAIASKPRTNSRSVGLPGWERHSEAEGKCWRIGIVDDHSIMRAVIRTIAEDAPDFNVAWSVASLADARRSMRQEVPDLLIVDLNLPDGTGYELLRECALTPAPPKALMISMQRGLECAREALQCGACGFLFKEASAVEFLTAINSVLSGTVYCRPSRDY